jgi:hypothetical protein
LLKRPGGDARPFLFRACGLLWHIFGTDSAAFSRFSQLSS